MSAFPANAALVAAPGTIMGLHAAIRQRLAAIGARFALETKVKDETNAPSVVDGWLPPKVGEADQFPFLIVRPRTGSDSEQGQDENATAGVDIIVGTYSDNDGGWFDVAILIDAIRADLGAAPAIAGTAYEHIGPLTWEIPEQQPRPQWFGTVHTNWQIPRPRRRAPDGG
jgi:hypothetical protein